MAETNKVLVDWSDPNQVVDAWEKAKKEVIDRLDSCETICDVERVIGDVVEGNELPEG